MINLGLGLLIVVGTMPSITSHGVREYYAHASNAFWWIVGEALGFRRGGPRTEEPWPWQFLTKPSKSILENITHDSTVPILGYQEQVEALTGAGFALWDVGKECNISNSDDNSVRDSKPNDIQHFVETQHPTVNRIVFASGKTSAKIFIKHNKEWLRSGKFVAGAGEYSREVFPDAVLGSDYDIELQKIELLVPYSVSPAAASISFISKKEQWCQTIFKVSQC